MNLLQGTLLQGGKYRIESVLGQGGFGVTYRGVQTGLNRQVTIKEFFMKEYCERDEATSHVTLGSQGSRELVGRFRQKFLKEAQIIANLKNPHIIGIHDIFEENGTAYYVMEYLSGGSLKDLVMREGTLSEEDALVYIRQLADALAFIHDRKILHLDVKPSNVLLESRQTAVLIDFGISKRYDEGGSQTSSAPVGISKGFAPLEQYKQGGVGDFAPCTDIYSLGATLYFLLSGNNPPEASDVNDDGLPPLPARVSAATAKAVEQAMQPKRRNRPQSISDFLALLDKPGEQGKAEDDKREEKEEETVVLDKPKSLQEPAQQVDKLELRSRNAREWKKWILGCIALFVFAIVGYLLLRGNGGNASGQMDAETDSSLVAVEDSIAITDSLMFIEAQAHTGNAATTHTNEQSNTLSENVPELHQGENASVFLNDYSQLRIGDFYYSDGTFSHKRSDAKTCVGVVFTLQTTVAERKHGWTHGQIVALKDAGNGREYVWGPCDELPAPHKEYVYSDALQDRDGYLYTHSGYTNGNDFAAFDAARRFSVPLPAGKTSGWYLPSIGQWGDILKNLGKVTLKKNGDNLTEFNNTEAVKKMGFINMKKRTSYWSSTECNAFSSWVVSFSIALVYAPSRLDVKRVRPLAAF